VYFPTLMLMPMYEELYRRARCIPPGSPQPARARARLARSCGTRARTAMRARPAVSACIAGAGPTGARP